MAELVNLNDLKKFYQDKTTDFSIFSLNMAFFPSRNVIRLDFGEQILLLYI